MERIGFAISHIAEKVPWSPPEQNPGCVPDDVNDLPNTAVKCSYFVPASLISYLLKYLFSVEV